MSGIAGIIYKDATQVTNLINPLLDTLAHRGPSIKNECTFRNMQVGITGGTFSDIIPGIIVGLDGLLTNPAELIHKLQEAGHHITEESDANLIARAYRAWGDQAIKHLQGDFAFFILDQKQERIIIARDRIGKKPLYWFHDQQHFIFASELKAILATGAAPQAIAPDAIAAYLYFGYIPQDMSPIKNINKMLPGYYLEIQSNQHKMIHNYWSYSQCFEQKTTEKGSEFISKVENLLQESVQQRLPTRQKVGCIVAGGLGSASIAHYLKQNLSSENIVAYTEEFQNELAQDSASAKQVASALNLKQYIDRITPDNFLDDLPKMIWHLDEPVADLNMVATWRLSKSAQASGIFYTGTGSDEFLIGHSRYSEIERPHSFKHSMLQACMPLMQKYFLPLANKLYKPTAYSLLQKARTNPQQIDFLDQNALFSNSSRYKAAPDIANLFDPFVFLHKFHNLANIPSTTASLLYLDIKTKLPDQYMIQYERFMTAHGLDWRTPYIYQPLIEYLAGMPEPEAFINSDTFFILKELLKDAFPPEFINRPKKSRSAFLHSWIEKSELLSLFQRLLSGTLVESGIISQKWLREQLSSMQKIQESFRQLWSLLTLELWFQLYINKPITSQAPEMSAKQLLKEG